MGTTKFEVLSTGKTTEMSVRELRDLMVEFDALESKLYRAVSTIIMKRLGDKVYDVPTGALSRFTKIYVDDDGDVCLFGDILNGRTTLYRMPMLYTWDLASVALDMLERNIKAV